MRFTEHFGVTRRRGDDWYDPHLSVDTKLFVDPLLVLKKGLDGTWKGAHDELIAHFVLCYHLVARGGNVTSLSAKRANRLLTFPEPSEFCLGYTSVGTRGSGGGPAVARQMTDGIAVAIAAGLKDPEHIEEIGILNEGVGADRISDAVCNVLKQRFIVYTRGVAARHGIALNHHVVRNARCFADHGRWLNEKVELPTNPINGKPILLAPSRFLNDLPILNAHDWFESQLNDDIRTEVNVSISGRVPKREIVAWARRHPNSVRAWAREQRTHPEASGYDFAEDPAGVVNWDGEPGRFAAANPISGVRAVDSQDDLRLLLGEVLTKFKHFVESQRGWSLLWNTDGSEKPEEAAQLVFLGMAQHYLRLFNIELDREVELGRGPVDFKLSSGTKVRLLVEVKKAHNGKFWLGLDHQLPTYLESDDAPEGWFVAIRYRGNKASASRMRELPVRVAKVADQVGKEIRYFAIDGRRPTSASKGPGSG